MTDTNDLEEDNTRALLNSVLQGSRHVDWQNAAHAHQTLLMKLCYFDPGNDSILEILDDVFSLNPNVNLRDDYGRTAFAHACISQNYCMVDALLFLGSTLIDTVDKEECSPLVYAIKADDEHLVDKMLSHPKAGTSKLLAVRTKGKTPLDLASSLGNPAIVDALKSFARYASGRDSDPTGRAMGPGLRPPLPEVRFPCRAPPRCVPPSRAFITAKSHSDPLLLTRVRQRKSLVPEVGMSVCSLSRRQMSHHNSSRDAFHDQAAGHGTDTLLPPSDSALSQRRGSLSLPDLSLIPRVVLEPCSDSEESGVESCPGVDTRYDEREDSNNDSDAEQDLTEEEILHRMAAANARRNSISLPALCSQTLTSKKHRTPESHGSNSHRDLPSLTNQNERRIHPRERISDLRLPAINMCHSPSLPALDRKFLRAQELQKHNSAQNLNLSVRRPIMDDGESLRRLLGRRKDDVQSIT